MGGIEVNEENDIKDAIKAAIQMEKDGYSFYKKAAAQTSSEMGRTVFEGLAQDELVHLDVFQKLFDSHISASEWNALVSSSKKYENIPVFPRDLTSIDEKDQDTSDLDALRIAMDSEQEAIEYYSKLKNNTESNSIKEILEEIIEQEKNHYQILQEEFYHLSKTGYWFELDFLGG
jgi:rubrerythrin